MESSLVYCLMDYIKENQLLLILTAVLMVLALLKSLPCKRKAKGLVREVASTTADRNSFEHKGYKDFQNRKNTLILTAVKMADVQPSPPFSQGHLGSSESLYFRQPIQIYRGSILPPMDSVEPLDDHEMEEDTHTRHKPNPPVVTEDQVGALQLESLDNKEQEGLRCLEIQNGKHTLVLTSTEKVVVLPSLHFSQGLFGSSESLNGLLLVQILSKSILPPMYFAESLGDHEMKKDTSTWDEPDLPVVTEDQVGALKTESLDKKEYEGRKSLEIQNGKNTLFLTSTEKEVVLPSLHFSQGRLGISEALPSSPPAQISSKSKRQLMDLVEPLGVGKDSFTGHKPNPPIVIEGKEEALRPKSYSKTSPRSVKFKRSVRPPSKQQPLSISYISAIGITKIISLDPPVCVLKSQKRKLAVAEMILQVQNDMSPEQITLPMDQLIVTDMICAQKGIKVTQNAVTKTESQEPRLAWQEPRSTRPRTVTKVPKMKPTLKLHQKFDDHGRNPEIKAELVPHWQRGCAKTEESNRNGAEVKDKFLEFAKSFQKRIQEALSQ